MLQGRWVVSAITAVCLSCSDGEEETGAGTPGGETVVRPGDPLPEATLVPALAAMNSCFSDDGFYRTSTSLRGRQGGYSYPGVPLDCLA